MRKDESGQTAHGQRAHGTEQQRIRQECEGTVLCAKHLWSSGSGACHDRTLLGLEAGALVVEAPPKLFNVGFARVGLLDELLRVVLLLGELACACKQQQGAGGAGGGEASAKGEAKCNAGVRV